MLKLSILIPTVPSRIELFYIKLMKELLIQIEPYKNEIELISLFDNKKRSIGKKRQEMINLAQGEYIVFIDDDDRISEDYISQIMSKLYENPTTDCVVFDSIFRLNGGVNKLCKYGVEFAYGDINNGLEWRGKPAHTMVYASHIVKKHQYIDMGNGEDYDWVKRACLDIKNQTRIDKVLYYYDAEYSTLSETSGLSDEIILENINKRLNK
jgi:glycosyltransferase involved in cell wall biosynthesis